MPCIDLSRSIIDESKVGRIVCINDFFHSLSGTRSSRPVSLQLEITRPRAQKLKPAGAESLQVVENRRDDRIRDRAKQVINATNPPNAGSLAKSTL